MCVVCRRAFECVSGVCVGVCMRVVCVWWVGMCYNNNIFIWYSATSIIVRGASQHITI